MKSNTLEAIGNAVAGASIRYRWLCVLLCSVLCIGVGMSASTLRFAGDYRVFFGPENPDYLANESVQATFGKPDNIAFVIIPDAGNVYVPDTLTAIESLTDLAWTLPYVSRVDSLTNFQNTQGVEDDLIVEDLVVNPAALDAEEIARIRDTASREPLVDGFIVAHNGGATVVNAVIQLPPDVQNAASATVTAAREIRDAILEVHPNHEIHLTGVAALSAAFEEAGVRDSSTLIPAVYGFILVVTLIALRSVSAVIATLCLIALSTLVGVGTGGLTGVALTPISLAAPTIILTIAVADAIHVIAGIRTKMLAGMGKRDAVRAATALNFAPISITSLTTVIGFLTLNFSDSPPFHHLGNMSAAGIAAAWVLSVTFLPAALSLLPLRFKASTDGNTQTGTNALINGIANTVIARPRTVAAVTLTLFVGVAAAIPTLSVNDQWSQYFDTSLEFRQAIDAAAPYFGTDNIEFVLDPGVEGGVSDPAFLRVVESFTAFLRSQDSAVAHVFSLSDIIKRLSKNLNADNDDDYRIPDSQVLVSQYLLVYELSLPYGLDLNDRIDIDRRSTRVTATMKDISTVDTRAFIDGARAWFEENGEGYRLDVTGSKVLFAFVAERNIDAVFEGAVYLVAVIFLILALTFRSIKIGAISLIPNALPILAAFGLWALLVGVVGFSIAAVGAVAVGLIVDYTVHFLAKYLRAREDGSAPAAAVRYAFDTAGMAIFYTTVILVAGFCILVTSTFKLNADLGLLTAIAVVLAMVVNFTLLPALFLLPRSSASAATALTPSQKVPS
ncbi:MAG: MMPL family transporter [Pseudomonadota bacterium]